MLPSSITKMQLGIYEIGVYVMLSSHMNGATRTAFPSVATLARECGISENSVRKALRSLCERGLISRTDNFVTTASGGRRRGSNIYTICSVETPRDTENESNSTFDCDEFFQAALRRSRMDDD